MPDFSNFLDPNYLFEKNPGASFKFYFPLLLIFGFLFLFSIFFPLFLKKKDKENPSLKTLSSKISFPGIIISIFGFLLLFFRYENLPYLSSRFLLFLLFFIWFSWFVLLLFYLFKDYQKEYKIYLEAKEKEKYLPKVRKR